MAELTWRGALADADKTPTLQALSAASDNPLQVLLDRGVDPDDLIQAAATAAGLTPAPKRLLQEPGGASLDVEACIREGGVPLGERNGTPLVAFCDPDRVLDAAVALPQHQALLALPRDHERARLKVLSSSADRRATTRMPADEAPDAFEAGATVVASELPPQMLEVLRQDSNEAGPGTTDAAPTLALSLPSASAALVDSGSASGIDEEAPTVAVSSLSASPAEESWQPEDAGLAAAARAGDRGLSAAKGGLGSAAGRAMESNWVDPTDALGFEDHATVVAPPSASGVGGAAAAAKFSELDTSSLHVDTSLHKTLTNPWTMPEADALTLQSEPLRLVVDKSAGSLEGPTAQTRPLDAAVAPTAVVERPDPCALAADPPPSSTGDAAPLATQSTSAPADPSSGAWAGPSLASTEGCPPTPAAAEAPTKRMESASSDHLSELEKDALRSIPRYKVERVLGRGGMATVHLATDKETGAKVAVKILEEHLAEDAIFIERFRREVTSTQSLDHENIIRLFDAGESGATYYMVTEYVDGGTLSEMLKKTGPMPVGLVVPLLDMALAGLHYAHTAGTIHRDLKPANLMLTQKGVLKIADFGIAKTSTDETLTQTGTLFGTPAYMSPEQAMGRILDHRSDLFSIGIVFYQLLTGLNPFHSENPSTSLYKIANGRFPPLFSIMPWVPDQLDQVIMRLLEVDRDKRFVDGQAARSKLAPLKQLLDELHPGAVVRALADARPVASELRAVAAERQVAHAKAQLTFDPPRAEEAAFRCYLASRLDSSNYDAINQVADLRVHHGFRFEAEPEARINEVHKALKENKPTPALLRRAHDLHAAQKDLFGMARFGKQYLRMVPHDAHMRLLAHRIVGDDPLAPYSPPPTVAPEFTAESNASEDIVPGLAPAGGAIRAAAKVSSGAANKPPSSSPSTPVATLDAVPDDEIQVVKTGPDADLEPAPRASEALANEDKAAPAGPADSFDEMLQFFREGWEEVVRSFTGDQGVEGLKAWWHDRFNEENKKELREQAQALLGQSKQAIAQSKEAILAEENRAKLQVASQSFWQRHRRVIMLGVAVLGMLWLLKLGCGLAVDFVRGEISAPTMGSESNAGSDDD